MYMKKKKMRSFLRYSEEAENFQRSLKDEGARVDLGNAFKNKFGMEFWLSPSINGYLVYNIDIISQKDYLDLSYFYRVELN